MQKLLELPSPKIRIGSDLIIEIAAIVTTKTDLRVPTVAELVPKDSLGVPELKDRWKSARESLIATLPGDKHAPWILHPAFGPLSGELMGKLLGSHLEHHLRHWPAPKA